MKRIALTVFLLAIGIAIAGLSLTMSPRMRLSSSGMMSPGAVMPQQAQEQLKRLGYVRDGALAPPAPAPAAYTPFPKGSQPAAETPAPSPDAVAASQPDRYLIKNATVSIETDNARAAADQLTAAVQSLGGYVSNMQESLDGLGRRSITFVYRVPADKFDPSMTQMESLGRVLNKQITTEDVTEQYIDTDARTRNLKRTEERLLDHLTRAGKLDEVIHLEQEITRVRSEIEQLDGRLRFLSHRIAYSTVTVSIQEKPKAEPVLPAAAFSTAQVASEAVRSLVGFAQSLWVRVIWWGVWSPVWIPIILIAWLAYRRAKRGLAS